MNKKLKEKNLISIMVLVIGLLLVIIIAYNLYLISKIEVPEGGGLAPSNKLIIDTNKPDDRDYKKIIEESKSSYKAFMDKAKTTSP